MKRWLPIAALIAASLTPIAAPAASTAVEVHNTSKSCAWITIYASYPGLPWAIVVPPVSLRAGQSHLFKLGSRYYTDVKARAEVKKNADCSGGNIADVQDYRKGLNPGGEHRLTVRIWDSVHGYHITF